MKKPENIKGNEKGSVFILVLWSLFFLGTLALVVSTMVSSNIRLSTQMTTTTTARSLARGGISFAIMELTSNITNWEVKVGMEMASDEKLFKDNDKLDGGTFTIYYEHIAQDSGILVTNYGLLDESSKKNINSLNVGEMKDIFKEIAAIEGFVINAEAIAKEIYNSRNVVDIHDRSSLGSSYQCAGENREFKLLQELLLLKSFESDAELFDKLEPYLTVYPEGCYQATAVGSSLVPGGDSGQSDLLAEIKIDFVFNSKSGKMVYWYEY